MCDEVEETGKRETSATLLRREAQRLHERANRLDKLAEAVDKLPIESESLLYDMIGRSLFDGPSKLSRF